MATIARVNLKSIALPTEHGGWGFLLEPILLATLVAPSWQGLILALATVSLFLLHQPFKFALKDNLKRRRVPRTIWAERFAAFYGSTGLILLALLIILNGTGFITPMLFGGIFALVQVFYDSRNKSRDLIPELAGAIALASMASSIALLAGWEIIPALILWLILSVRAVTAIIYVRVRLRMSYGRPHNKSLAISLHLVALVLFIALVMNSLTPILTALAMLILLIRAIKGLYFPVANTPAKVIGFTELGFGIGYVLLVAVGYWLMLL